jgi:hypothetical protein
MGVAIRGSRSAAAAGVVAGACLLLGSLAVPASAATRATGRLPAGAGPAATVAATTVTLCPPGFSAAYAKAAGVSGITVAGQRSADLAVCNYRARHVPARRCGSVEVTVNAEPNAFRDFQRWAVETGQTASESPAEQAVNTPHVVNDLGVEADWVPSTRLLSIGETDRWVEVMLGCPLPATPSRRLAVALGHFADHATAKQA